MQMQMQGVAGAIHRPGRCRAALGEAARISARRDIVVLGLPRGGVPVAFEVARALGAPLDVIVVRKLGVPFQPELAMGAIGEGGVRVENDEVLRRSGITEAELAAVEQRELADLAQQAQRFRVGRRNVDIAGRNVIVIDDGIATGSTASAACQVARLQGAATGDHGGPGRRARVDPGPACGLR